MGVQQLADLGDGRGNVSQIGVLRWNFGNPYVGTCKQTFEGGLHFRYWKQNNTGALFLAASVEMDLERQHDIVPNGYNLGRDYLVGNLTGVTFDSRSVTNATTFEGTSSYANYSYHTSVMYQPGLLQNDSGAPARTRNAH